jgi:2-iminoacetate synthase ThiH
MGRLLSRAIEHAGLSDVAERALSGAGLGEGDLARLRASDVLLVAALADAVRARFHGEEVRVYGLEAARREPDLQRVSLDAGRSDGPTGQELLFEIAIARLEAPASKSIAVSLEQLGLELAQTALTFGADALIGDLTTKRTLPLADGPGERRKELAGLLERAGRRIRFADEPSRLLEQTS